MILMYTACAVLGLIAFFAIGFFLPSLSIISRVLISVAATLAVAVSATIWIYYAAQKMPDDATIVTPIPKQER